MTRYSKTVGTVFLTAILFISSQSLFSQQSSLQTSFFAPAAIRTNSVLGMGGVAASIVRVEHLPYLSEVAKESHGAAPFQPTPSDLLIQQAEERFRTGRKFYQDSDFDHARGEFDAAIGIMLQASDNPTDRSLFESRLEDMVDAIHRDDLEGMGAAAPEEVPGFDKAPLDDIVTMTFPVDSRTRGKVQSEVKLTSSALPLVVNDAVLSYIDYFNGRGHKTIE